MKVREFLQEDRQWKRHLRIAHAKMQLNKAKTPQDNQFWEDVIKANQDD